MNYPEPGPNLVAEYQVAGLPFAVSGSTGRVTFPFVTQWFWVHPTAGSVKIGFTEAGLNSTNYFTITAAEGPTPIMNLKVKELWLSGSAEIVAGLTMVRPHKMWDYVHPPASGSVGGPGTNTTGFGYNGI